MYHLQEPGKIVKNQKNIPFLKPVQPSKTTKNQYIKP